MVVARPLRAAPAMALSADATRREALGAAASAFAAAALPQSVFAKVLAPERNEEQLKESIYLILRVIEATAQEERLINSGKYKDLQRKSVKNAASMMLENYALEKNLVKASIFVPQDQVAEAQRISAEAAEALSQIVGYFPAELSVGELEASQKQFVLKAFTAARTNLNDFIKLLPEDAVTNCRKKVEEENKLNADDYNKFFGEPMLNMPPTK
mmetsp:Transcript_14139/g.34235  ORF Transcript_14139/g.34235 Transcript_14139/m.34235 type:complete len:213 (+) Transcript_14139:2-640(+)